MQIEKVDKTDYVVHIKKLKQALNHGLVLKKVHRVNKFNQKALLKPYEYWAKKKPKVISERLFEADE